MPTRPSRRRREADQRGTGYRVQGTGKKPLAPSHKANENGGRILPPFLFPFLYSLPDTLDPIPDTLSFQSVKIADAYVTALEVAASR
jgi:hypothetical protein